MKLAKFLGPVAVTLLLPGVAFAQDAAPNQGYIAIGAGLAIGLAALGGTLGQSNAARANYESIARNPQAADKLNTPFILGLAFIESLVIFAFVIAFLLQGNL
jgi:F-type H+-transporting ATPase subunit c